MPENNHVRVFDISDRAITRKRNYETVRIEPWGVDSVRVRATYNPEIIEGHGALLKPAQIDCEVFADKDEAVLRNGEIEVHISRYGRIRFLRSNTSAALLEEVWFDERFATLYPAGRQYRALGDRLYSAEARFAAYAGEKFFGLGQHRHGLLDQKGATIELFQRNGEVTIPLLISSRMYGFLWNNPAVGRVELSTNRTRWVADQCQQIDYYITTGDSYSDIMSNYADATGHAPALPKFASGFWQSKLRYRSQEELLEVAREYKRRGLPLSVIVADFFHWKMQGQWDWDSVAWPDTEAMVRELQDMQVKLMVSVWPSVNPNSCYIQEMKQRGLLVRSDRGLPYFFDFQDSGKPDTVPMHYYDATNPESREFVWNLVRRNHYQNGIKMFWLDCCEPEMNRYDHDNMRFHAGSGAEVANRYPLDHQQAFFDGMLAEGETEIINLCRSAWAGSQRLGAALWSGDIPSTFESFNIQVRAGLNVMMSGIPWWTTDIGGFMDGNIEDRDFRELLLRWFQYGVFCPLFRLHGIREPLVENDICGAPNEVWSYGEDIYSILKYYLLMRERLRPYITEQMDKASAAGIPPMRPVFFDFPDDPECYSVEDELMLGPDILAAPVMGCGERSRNVYLPVGADWTDAWTGEVRAGGQWIVAEAPLEQIPVYMKSGADLPIRANSLV